MHRHSKQVRFASQITVYPSETSVASIAVSISPSGSASSGSPTLSPYPSKTHGLPGPTPYMFLSNPRPKLPEPTKYTNRQSCHPLLDTSAISYDLREPISTATHNNHPLSIATLHESAFMPPLSHITITSSYLPWTIKVHQSNTSYITIEDFLTSVYRALRTNITHTEFQLLPSGHDRKRAIHAYQHRYRRLRCKNDLIEEWRSEKHAGMRRVDFLMGYTIFLGISSKGCQANDEWNLRVASSTTEL